MERERARERDSGSTYLHGENKALTSCLLPPQDEREREV